MPFTATMDTRGLEKTLDGWEKKQLPFATALALTRTGQLIKQAEVAKMKQVFKNPTPFTLNSLYLKPATKSDLSVTVSLKNTNQKGSAPSVWLEPQISGGTRQVKRGETLLRNKGLLPGGMFYVPGSGATLDRYGNMSRGQIVQVYSALKAMGESGYLANKSNRLGARANANANRYFVVKPGDKGSLKQPGVYYRMADGSLKVIMVFVKSPHYRKLLPFYEVAQQVYAAEFQGQFNQALRDALILSPFLDKAA